MTLTCVTFHTKDKDEKFPLFPVFSPCCQPLFKRHTAKCRTPPPPTTHTHKKLKHLSALASEHRGKNNYALSCFKDKQERCSKHKIAF